MKNVVYTMLMIALALNACLTSSGQAAPSITPAKSPTNQGIKNANVIQPANGTGNNTPALNNTEVKSIIAAHKISEVIPNKGPRQTEVTISGENFGNNLADLQVKLNGIAAIVLGLSDNQIRVIVPDKAGSGPISVKIKDKTAVGAYFIYEWTATVSTFAGMANTNGYRDGNGTNARIPHPSNMYIDRFDNLFVYSDGGIRAIDKYGEVTTAAASSAGAILLGEEFPRYKYVFDRYRNKFTTDYYRITKTTPAGVVTVFAGTNHYGKQDGIGEGAGFAEIKGIAIDAKGNLFITERDDIELMSHGDRVRMISPEGRVMTIAGGGTKYIGQKGFKDGIGEEALFSYPYDIVVDSRGNLFVSDHFNNCIRKITLE